MRPEIYEKIHDPMSIELKNFQLDNLNIRDDEISEIAHAIKNVCPGVEIIMLNNNNIGDKGAKALGRELAVLSKLTFIDLQFNQINQEGMRVILSLKQNHPALSIALHGNNMSNTGDVLKLEDDRSQRSPKI